MKPHRSLWLLVLVVLALLAACEKAGSDPTATPPRAEMEAASTLFAEPTRAPAVAATVTPSTLVELELSRSAARMEQAVLSGDVETYLSYVSQSDPVFWADHRAWAQDWAAHPVSAFSIELFGIAQADGEATTRMTITWSQADSDISGGATVSTVFREEDGTWKLIGEDWERAETEGIVFYYFANEIVDNTSQAQTVIEYLPAIYTGVVREFDYVPSQPAHIKMFESERTLATMTRISQPGLTLWNVPGESIKLPLGPSRTAPRQSLVGTEYTRFLLFDLAGGERENLPRWLENGIAAYGGAQFQTLSQRNRTLKNIAGLSLVGENSERRLLSWEQLADLESLSREDRLQAVDQAYTFVHYVTETYGAEARNVWVAAMAGGASLDDASQTALGVTFDTLAQGWREWLPTTL